MLRTGSYVKQMKSLHILRVFCEIGMDANNLAQ